MTGSDILEKMNEQEISPATKMSVKEVAFVIKSEEEMALFLNQVDLWVTGQVAYEKSMEQIFHQPTKPTIKTIVHNFFCQ